MAFSWVCSELLSRTCGVYLSSKLTHKYILQNFERTHFAHFLTLLNFNRIVVDSITPTAKIIALVWGKNKSALRVPYINVCSHDLYTALRVGWPRETKKDATASRSYTQKTNMLLCPSIICIMKFTMMMFINRHTSKLTNPLLITTILLCKNIKRTMTITWIKFINIHRFQNVHTSKHYNITLQKHEAHHDNHWDQVHQHTQLKNVHTSDLNSTILLCKSMKHSMTTTGIKFISIHS